MRALLISNFLGDKQKSMNRFSDLLTSNFSDCGIHSTEVRPTSYISKFCSTPKLIKLGGYLDKYFIFPKKIETLVKRKSFNLIHILDHSNSIYLPKLSKLCSTPKVTTCHDLIAIRTASGDFSMAPNTSYQGKKLQQWIKKSLRKSDFYACDSVQTQSDLNKIIPESRDKSKVIHLGVKQNQLKKDKILNFDLQTTRYALHVGSSSWYKNRKGVLKSFKFSQEKQSNCIEKLVLVGPKIQNHEVNGELENWIKKNRNKLIITPNISDEELQALYQQATLLIFPSFIEGYGWPPLEAFANNCYSVTTKTGAIFEILKDCAAYADPNNQKELNHLVYSNILKNRKRESNKPLPTNAECAKKYAKLYRQVVQNNP